MSSVSAILRQGAASSILALAAVAVQAHPGHASAPAMGWAEGLAHLLTQPDHLALLALAVGTACFVVRKVRARRRDEHRH